MEGFGKSLRLEFMCIFEKNNLAKKENKLLKRLE